MSERSWSNEQWTVSTNKTAISDSAELGEIEARLGIPMPEMVFGKNFVEIKHDPTQVSIRFNAIDALDEVDKSLGGKTKILQVAHSDKWRASKIKHILESPPAPAGQLDYDVNRVHRPFDWTYTTPYMGTAPLDWQLVENEGGIPYDLLRKKEPILFFDDVQLYEDELGDFGLTTFSVKIRVMPRNLFVLARLYMRVDNVAFRTRDTRIFIDFDTNEIIREHCEKEGNFTDVKAKVPVWTEDYMQLLRDPNWVDSVLDIEMKENARCVPK